MRTNLCQIAAAMVVHIGMCLIATTSVTGENGPDPKVVEPTSAEIARAVEKTYREFPGCLQVEVSIAEAYGQEKPIKGVAWMSRGSVLSFIRKDDQLVRAFSLSPDGKCQRWGLADGSKVNNDQAVYPQGLNLPYVAGTEDIDCLMSMCSYSFVGVSRWEDLGQAQAGLTESDYNAMDEARYWRRVILRGERNPFAELASLGWGHDCYVFTLRLDADHSDSIYINKKSFLVERWDVQKLSFYRLYRYNYGEVPAKLPPDFTWKIDTEVKKAQAVAPPKEPNPPEAKTSVSK